jgi:hypothetical protein
MQPESSVLTPFPAARVEAIAASLAGDPDFVALLRLDPAYPHEHALELVADISARLRRACSHFADDDYAALVLDVARTRVRFHRLDHQSGSLAGPQRLSG